MTETAAPPRPLTALDLCDRCGAQAYIRVQLNAGELLFCAHHGQQHSKALAKAAVEDIHSETDRLFTEQDNHG